jgi:hypothetical protein
VDNPHDQPPVPPAVASGKLLHFLALPDDPLIRLSEEQLDTLFPVKNRAVFVRELVRLAKAAEAVNNAA